MIAQVTGAFARAVLVMVLIVTPSLLLPSVSADATQIVALVAVSSAALIMFEYLSIYPSIVEFRDAPPFNRIRFGAMLIAVFTLSIICGSPEGSLHNVAATLGRALDFPYSPVHLFTLMPADDIAPAQAEMVRAAAGMAYLLSIASICLFSIIVRALGWPMNNGNFNVWVNLPTFDPTTSDDVVTQLQRAAWVNLVLGFLLPFLFPAAVTASMVFSGPLRFEDPQTLIWMATGWAMLPSSLVMRSIALFRIAQLISDARSQADAEQENGLQLV